jgi:UDP-3-O-[3-hydroxymyristoyl] glucosamine N-acyltransferase
VEIEDMKQTVAEVADFLNGEVIGDGTAVLKGLASLKDATASDLAFLADLRFKNQLAGCEAGAILVSVDIECEGKTLIRVEDPDAAFNKMVLRLRPAPRQPEAGVHKTAVVDAGAEIDSAASVGPYCVIESGVKIAAGAVLYSHVAVDRNTVIGSNTVIWPMVSIREECVIGDNCLIHAGVVIGFDGFGFNNKQGVWEKVPQLGNVVIGNNVELGASVTISRGRFSSTVLGDGVKVDASSQIGHGAKIGKNSYIGAQSGFGGSCEIGDYVTIAPHSGVAPSVKICDQVILAAQTAVLKDIDEKGTYWGIPALPHMQQKRRKINTANMGELIDEVKELRKKIEALENSKNNK